MFDYDLFYLLPDYALYFLLLLLLELLQGILVLGHEERLEDLLLVSFVGGLPDQLGLLGIE